MTETVDFQVEEGIAFVSQGERMQLAFHRNLVFFDSKNRDVMSIEYADITAVEIITETIKKDKSVIGRAVVGGLLLGPIGAVVGGISGMGKKEIYHYYLLITYGADDNTVLLKSYDKSPKTCEKVINLIQKNRKDDCLYQWL